MDKALPILTALLKIAGDLTLSEAITWVEVKENADKLLAEGHDPEEKGD